MRVENDKESQHKPTVSDTIAVFGPKMDSDGG